MFRLRTVAVVVLLAALSLLTLRLMGLSQWIQAILIIGVELLLGLVLHNMFGGTRRGGRRTPKHRPGHRPSLATHRRKHVSGHSRLAGSRAPETVPEPYAARCRLLLPLRDDRPGLIDYAIRECRSHRAELDLLFLRVTAGASIETDTEPAGRGDLEARGIIEDARRRARRACVPFRAIYAVTPDAPAMILDLATAREADLVVMAAPRHDCGPSGLKVLACDDVRAVLDALPEHIGLLVHA